MRKLKNAIVAGDSGIDTANRIRARGSFRKGGVRWGYLNSSAADRSSLNRMPPASTDGSGGQLLLKQNALLGTEREDDTG
jgi:hypothetical protein